MSILLMWSLFFVWCGTNTTSNNLDNQSDDVTKNECMQWCKIMRKTNSSNAERTNVDMQSDCDALCEAGQGMQNVDASSCQKSEGILKDICLSDVANQTKNSDICKEIEDITMINSCYTSIAQAQNDSSICQNIQDNMRKNICEDEVATKE